MRYTKLGATNGAASIKIQCEIRMTIEDRIRADFTDIDLALTVEFEAFIRDQQAQGRLFDRRAMLTEFFEWHTPDLTDDQLDAEVTAAMQDAATLRRSKLD